jgi:hypothetical protein
MPGQIPKQAIPSFYGDWFASVSSANRWKMNGVSLPFVIGHRVVLVPQQYKYLEDDCEKG